MADQRVGHRDDEHFVGFGSREPDSAFSQIEVGPGQLGDVAKSLAGGRTKSWISIRDRRRQTRPAAPRSRTGAAQRERRPF